MSETATLKLPLVQAAQAQKHVTVNEAMARLDGLVQLRLASVTETTPPASVVDGAVYSIPVGATGAWVGHEGRLAIGDNGGWTFADPELGWQGWIVDQACPATCTPSGWNVTAVAHAPSGAGARFRTIEFDHVLGAGATSTTAVVIPANSMIFAVSARVISEITGTLTSWKLGDGGADNRYGSGMGVGVGSYATGLLGAPMTVYSDTALVLTASGGDFAGGTVRVAAQVFEIDLPGA